MKEILLSTCPPARPAGQAHSSTPARKTFVVVNEELRKVDHYLARAYRYDEVIAEATGTSDFKACSNLAKMLREMRDAKRTETGCEMAA